MLRSFAYAASAAELQRGATAARGLGGQARDGVPRRATSQTVDPSLLPAGEAATAQLLSIFELEKAVYELRYELNNRPDWVRIPVAGIVRLLERRTVALIAHDLGPARDPRRAPATTAASSSARCRPDAERVACAARRRRGRARPPTGDDGLFEGEIEGATLPLRYELEVAYPDGNTFTLRDPYAFPPTLGELDLHLAGEGRHEELYDELGAHSARSTASPARRSRSGRPNAARGQRRRRLQLAGTAALHPMRALGASGIWELFVPGVGAGAALQVRDPHADGAICA